MLYHQKREFEIFRVVAVGIANRIKRQNGD
jgi:hypothetical protein